MEYIKTCELCLEQITKTEYFENLNCDEKQNLNILKNLEVTVSRDANICSNCVNVSHLIYNFKTSCFANNDRLKTLIHPGINDQLVLEEVIVKKYKSEFKNAEKVCRLCLNFSEVNSLAEVNLEQDVVLKDMLGRCLPEIDMSIVQKPLICYICSELLEKFFNFISQCEDTEVLGNLETKTDILVIENKPTVNVAKNDDNVDESFVEGNCEGVEEPEFQIKSEDFDIDEDIKDSINDSNCLLKKEGEIYAKPSSFPSGLTHQEMHWKTRKSTINKPFKCTECLFQFNYQSSLVRHKKNSEEAYKCNICGFTASTKCEIVQHKKKSHKFKNGLGNVGNVKFPCNLCPYQASQKSSLKLHYRVHQNLSESEMFKCHKCPYITKWKKSLDVHNIRWHEDMSKLPKYNCDECPYETLWRWQLVNHKVKHRDPSEVKMYKCLECSHETKHKSSLKKHEKRHARNRQNAVKVEQSLSNSVKEKDVKPKLSGKIKEKKFVCDICSFKTTTKYSLNQHCLIHKEPSEVNVFKCDYCPFATKWKKCLTLHTMRHKNPSELPKFKCNDCPYETNKRRNLVSHVLVHKNLANMYRCLVCPYQTKNRSCIQVHKKKHQVEIYTCDKCNYKTKLKKSFMVHSRNHKEWKQPAKSNQNLKKVRQHKCNVCSYVGTRKAYLILHQLVHKDPSEREMYTCIECSFQALSKITLKRHYNKNHRDLEIPFGELKTFRCNEYDYETTYSKCISKHLQTHKQGKMMPSVKEELQEQDNMQDKEGT